MREPSDAEWQMIAARVPVAGIVLHAVTSTKIVCRPTCPARMPLRRNLRVADSLAEALAAGFRPCKRCRPEVG